MSGWQATFFLQGLLYCLFVYGSIAFVQLPASKHHPPKILFSAMWMSDSENQNDQDLFEYFDPLLSPHAYPKGISPETIPTTGKEDEDGSSGPSSKKEFGFRTPLPEVQDTPPSKMNQSDEQLSTATDSNSNRPLVDTSSTFDPTISPHAYATGTPDVVIGDSKSVYLQNVNTNRKIGILLMDHGSRNPASNQRLHDLAKRYDDTFSNSATIVRVAHMEIASPSIPDAIRELVSCGVDEIVCHPYFLSPGRHVQEDVPRIIADAVTAMNIEIPIKTTDPVGSQTDLMIQAIHSLVQKSATTTVGTSF